MVNFAFQDVEHPYPHNILTEKDFINEEWPPATWPQLYTVDGWNQGAGYFSFF